MHIDQRKEQFSRAYVQAVAAVAGFAHYAPSVDDDSIDMGLCARLDATVPGAPHMEMQIKCTNDEAASQDYLSYALKLKNYNDLRAFTLVPRILVVVLVPAGLSDWITQDESALALRRCGYWLSLRQLEPTDNVATVSVRLPRSQVFSVEQLQAIMKQVAHHEPL